MSSDKSHVIIKFDGASRGNPGPAGIGVIIEDEEGNIIDKICKSIGKATNNQAEYRALIASLEAAISLNVASVDIRSDSKLVVEQIRGNYKLREPKLKPLYNRACQLLSSFQSYTIKWVPREENQEADKLIDSVLK